MAKKTTSPSAKTKTKAKAKRPTAKPKAKVTATKPAIKQKAEKKRISLKIPSVWQLTKTAAVTLWKHKRLFISITLIYGLLNMILVQGLASGTDVGDIKEQLNKVFTGQFKELASSLSIFALLVSSAGESSNQTAGAYQLFIALISSLAIIWALRQVKLGSSIRVRDAFYRGMYPLVPFILVLLVIGLQLIPLIIGSALYNIVLTNGIAVQLVEQVLWAAMFGVLALSSLYMLSSSLFALYIVTLPNMTPMKALRSARKLVKNRRWTVLRKVLSLPVILLVVVGLIMVPTIIVLTPVAQFMFFILTMFSLVAIHAYMYTLYRELLNE